MIQTPGPARKWRPLSVYLAGSPEELDRVELAASVVTSLGCHLNDRWWRTPASHLLKQPWSQDQRTKLAIRANVAARSSDVYWLLYPEVPHAYPLMSFIGAKRFLSDRLTMITGPRASECVHCALSDYEASSDEAGFDYLQTYVRRVQQ